MISVPLSRPFMGPAEEEAVCQVLRSGWISQGPKVEKFERRLAAYLGSRHLCAVNSGTSAINLALRALGLGRGDSVVVPAFGCAASGLPVLETGAKPVFADIDPATFNVTAQSIARVIRHDTRAVLVAHMFGRVAEIEEIAAQCQARGLLLIEDAALAFGACAHGRRAGTFGAAGCFSFHPRKILTTGEGGAVCTDDAGLAAKMAEDRNYGAAQSAWSRFKSNNGSPHGFDRVAFNFKLTDIQAAIGLVQMKRLPRFLRERQRIARTYQRDLAGLPRIICPPFPDDPDGHVFQSFVCTWGSLEAASKGGTGLDDLEHSLSEFKLSLQRLGVAVSVAAQFLPELPVFNQARLRNQCPYAYAASRLTFALPIFHGMTKQETSYTLQSIKAVLAALPPD